MFRKHGFTLIELLVVVTVIVVLLALLSPALDKAVAQAERAVCASNLHVWGAALSRHALEHKNRLLTMPVFEGYAPYPNHPLIAKAQGAESGAVSLDEIEPYLTGVNRTTFDEVSTYWYCRSHGGEAHMQFNNTSARDRNPFNPRWLYPDYAFFAHDRAPGATHPAELSGNRLGSPGLVMADTLFRWASQNTWHFNHSEVGPSQHGGDRFGTRAYSGTPPLTGANQLFGDGGVTLKNDFDTQAMDPSKVGPRSATSAATERRRAT